MSNDFMDEDADESKAQFENAQLFSQAQSAAEICTPRSSDNKYSRGVVGLITGSEQYPGAAVLTTKAAARTGVGMVRYIGPERAQNMVLNALPEAVLGKGRADAWVVGSGVPNTDDGVDDAQKQAISMLLAQYAIHDPSDSAAADAVQNLPPVVVDAGALDLLPERVYANVVLTPHVGELARLLTRRGHETSVRDILDAPLVSARLAANLTGATVLLKGSTTIIVLPDYLEQNQALICQNAPAQLATAGAGDVLAGILGGFLASNYANARRSNDCCIYRMHRIVASAAFIHGEAACLASGVKRNGLNTQHEKKTLGKPIIASDVIEKIPEAIAEAMNSTSS